MSLNQEAKSYFLLMFVFVTLQLNITFVLAVFLLPPILILSLLSQFRIISTSSVDDPDIITWPLAILR